MRRNAGRFPGNSRAEETGEWAEKKEIKLHTGTGIGSSEKE